MGAAGPRRQCLEGGTGVAPGAQERCPPTAGALDPGLGLSVPGQPPARENPGPLPGAAALPGRAGEGIPGICPETAVASLGRIGPCMGSASAASAGKAPARAAGRGRACALQVSPERPAFSSWVPGPRPAPQPSNPGDLGTREGWDSWAGTTRCLRRTDEGDTYRTEPPTALSWGQTSAFFFPSALPAWKKRQQKLIKNQFFFLLK